MTRTQYLLTGALLSLVISPLTWAGQAEVVNTGGAVSQLEYRGEDFLRISDKSNGYMLHRQGKLFVVSGEPGNETVMDASSMMRMAGGSMQKGLSNVGQIQSLKKTARSETVAGIRGEVWTLVQTDSKGRTKTTELVMSADKRVREFRDAMFAFSRTMLVSSGKDSADADEMIAELKKRGRGVLRFGDEMTVRSIDGNKVAMERFDLPAEPMAMPSFFSSGDGEANSKKSGGAMSSLGSLFGKKAKRQQDRAEERTEDEVDDATDQAVDKALDKAFEKLFGG